MISITLIKNKLTTIIKSIASIFYMPSWLALLLCDWFGHKKMGRYLVYQTNKPRWRGRDKQHKTGGDLEVIKKYNPYMIYYCRRCKARLGEDRLKRCLTREEASKYSKGVMSDIKKYNEQSNKKQ